jgi:hypothetical protein
MMSILLKVVRISHAGHLVIRLGMRRKGSAALMRSVFDVFVVT